jgi:hypothetical protein
MTITAQWIATCDVNGPNCVHTATAPAETMLPEGWMHLSGNLFGSNASSPSATDACGACVLTLGAALPASWLAQMPPAPS